MLRFQHPEYFWFLLIIGLLFLLFISYIFNQRKRMQTIGEENMVNAMLSQRSRPLSVAKFAVLSLALFIAVIGLANLQAGAKTEKVTRKGIDVMIALDVSKSMLAKDIAPNRLERSRQFINKLLEKISNNRVGLILFAGRAYVSVPLTVDLSALKMNLSTASPDLVPTQGTVLGEAIKMAAESFNSKEIKFKSIVLLSDGEDHDEDVLTEVKKAVENGITIQTIGVGSVEGATIYDEQTQSNKLDENGKEIISKLNEKELIDIANKGHGTYNLLSQPESTAELLAKEINSTEQRNVGDVMFADYNSYFQYFLLAALLLVGVEFVLPESKKRTV